MLEEETLSNDSELLSNVTDDNMAKGDCGKAIRP
jgi:hypothetical protein